MRRGKFFYLAWSDGWHFRSANHYLVSPEGAEL
jgi:hypothetical protein